MKIIISGNGQKRIKELYIGDYFLRDGVLFRLRGQVESDADGYYAENVEQFSTERFTALDHVEPVDVEVMVKRI